MERSHAKPELSLTNFGTEESAAISCDGESTSDVVPNHKTRPKDINELVNNG
ncbi:MAG TPA: hypothetical protein VGO47_02555 [Chlamydiales bacterium]|nr:hypothetical protein [Chlamydiales bacterium]